MTIERFYAAGCRTGTTLPGQPQISTLVNTPQGEAGILAVTDTGVRLPPLPPYGSVPVSTSEQARNVTSRWGALTERKSGSKT